MQYLFINANKLLYLPEKIYFYFYYPKNILILLNE